MWDTIAQIGIPVFGVGAILLVSRKSKWGFVFGLLSQPFWFMTAIINKQVGIIVVNVAYTLSWAYGLYRWFREDNKKGE